MLNALLCFAVNPSEAVTLGCVNEVLLVVYMFSHGLCCNITFALFFGMGARKIWPGLN